MAEHIISPSIDQFAEELSQESDWYSLGIFLGAPTQELDTIGLNYRGVSTMRCLIELYKCLQSRGKTPSWELVANNLRRMNDHSLADRINSVYITPSPPPHHSSGTSSSQSASSQPRSQPLEESKSLHEDVKIAQSSKDIEPYKPSLIDILIEQMRTKDAENTQLKKENETLTKKLKTLENLTVIAPITAKEYFEKLVYPAFPRGNYIPELDYPYWFKPAVLLWIEDFQKKIQEVIKNAWAIDKAANFEPHSDQKFSSSSFNMIESFHKGQQVIKKFDDGVVEFRHAYNHTYAGVIKSTFVSYCDLISDEITNHNDLLVAIMLINSIQFLKQGVETLYNAMGGEADAGEKCTEEIAELQTILSRQVDSWCKYIGKSIKDSIWEGILQVQKEIINVESATGKSHCKFDKLLSRLFEHCKTFRDCCEENIVLPKIISRIWLIVIQGLHHMLLPPLLGIALEDTEESESAVVFATHIYSSEQCSVVVMLLDCLKDFSQKSLGVSEIDNKMAGDIEQLKFFTGLYGQTTNALILEFLEDFAAKASYKGSQKSGEVLLKIASIFRFLPSTGVIVGGIEVISAKDLLGFDDVQVLKPHIKLNIIASGEKNTTFKEYMAVAKDTSSSPSFNQTFKFSLPFPSWHELVITALHKTAFGRTRVIGVAVISMTALKTLTTIVLNHKLPQTKYGCALLTVLAQQPDDDIAKEFVELMTQSRFE